MSHMPNNDYSSIGVSSSLSSEENEIEERTASLSLEENEIEERITSHNNIDTDGLCGPGVVDDHRDNGATTGRDCSTRQDTTSSKTNMGDDVSASNEKSDVKNENEIIEADGEEQHYYRLSESNDDTNKGETTTITEVNNKETIESSNNKLVILHQSMESKFDDIFGEGRFEEVVKLNFQPHELNEARLDAIFFEKKSSSRKSSSIKNRNKHHTKTFDDIFSDSPQPPNDDNNRLLSSSSSSQSSSHSHDDDDDAHHQTTRRRRRHRGTLVTSILTFRKWCGRIVNHPLSQRCLVTLIILNGIMLGIGTYEFVTANPSVDEIFETIDFVFLLIFTFECLMNVVHLGCDLFRDGWLVLDLSIILVSWIFASLQVLRSFRSLRILRAFRIVRAVRLVTHVKMLRNLVVALTMVIPRMSAIIALMGIMFYVFAVLFTSLFKDMYGKGQVSVDYFGRMDKTLYTLFQIMTLDWADVAREVMVYYKWAWIPFVTFVCVSSFTVFNLIIAVICDSMSMLQREDKMKDIPAEVQMKVRKLATEMMFLKQNHDIFHNTMMKVNELLKNQTKFRFDYVQPEIEVNKKSKSSRWRLASFDKRHH